MLFFFSHAWNKGPPSFVKQICGLLFRVMHVNDYNEIAFLFEDENDMQSDMKMKKRGATAFQKQYVSLTKRNFTHAYKLKAILSLLWKRTLIHKYEDITMPGKYIFLGNYR